MGYRNMPEMLFHWVYFSDAIKEGDGSRLLHHINYTIEAFTLLAQERFLLSPRLALQLK